MREMNPEASQPSNEYRRQRTARDNLHARLDVGCQ